MKLVDVDNDGVPRYDKRLMTIPQFQKLIKRDRSPKKTTASKELMYIFFFVDYRSPYLDLFEEERTLKLVDACKLPKDWRPDKAVNDAVDLYRDLVTTPAVQTLQTTINTLKSTDHSLQLVTKLTREGLQDLEKVRLDYKNMVESGFGDDDEERTKILETYVHVSNMITEFIKRNKEAVSLSKDMIPVVKNISELEERIKVEATKSTKLKGGGEVGSYEEPNYFNQN